MSNQREQADTLCLTRDTLTREQADTLCLTERTDRYIMSNRENRQIHYV